MGFLKTEAGIHLGCFIGVFFAMAAWELLAPRRLLFARKPLRWGSNFGLVSLNSILMRLVAPLRVVGVAVFAQSQGWGLFHYIDAPNWFAILVSVILLDFAIYLQHVMFHAVPLLWRLHMVHHADLDFDVTTGLRFHTVEILLSFGIKAAVVLLIGPPAVAVLVFEVLLNATSMFNHSNVRMPLVLDRVLRWILVTPDMHRVHHSIHRRETNSNFGFSLPWWDRLLGTYRDQPMDGHTRMTIGLSQIRDEKQADRLLRMLALPFQRRAESYAIGGKAWISRGAPQSDQCHLDAIPAVADQPVSTNLDGRVESRLRIGHPQRLKLLDDSLHDDQVAEPSPLGRYDMPGRCRGRAAADCFAVGLHEFVPTVAVVEIPVGELPTLIGARESALKPLFLILPGDVQKELQHDRILARQQALESVDVLKATLPYFRRLKLLDADRDDILVMGTIENRDIATPRRVHVDSPEEIVQPFPLAGLAEALHTHARRIQLAKHTPSRRILPAGVHPLKDHQQTALLPGVEQFLQFDQALRQLLQHLLALLLADPPVLMGWRLAQIKRGPWGDTIRLHVNHIYMVQNERRSSHF